MRPDMAKVIVERPRHRWGSGRKGMQKERQKLGLEALPRREGTMKALRGGTKSLNEHLGPLRRYLLRQVGRPWDKVFAEICAHINRSSAVQDHVRDHVYDFVAVHVFLDGDVPCDADTTRGGQGYGRPLVCREKGLRLYVCPDTGLLRPIPLCPEHTKRGRAEAYRKGLQRPEGLAWLDALHFACRVEGQWRMVQVRPFPEVASDWTREHDPLLRRALTRREAIQVYGQAILADSWRVLGKRERRQLPIPE